MSSEIEMSVGLIEAIEPSDLDTALVVPIAGELDMSTCDVVKPAVMAAIASAAFVILDLAALTFCDSSGIAMFLAAHDAARTEGTAFALRHVVGPPRRALELTRAEKVLCLID